MRRAAIVIGVNRPTGLDPLSGAHRSANEIADWLEGVEGFAPVHRFLDEVKEGVPTSVELDAIKKAVRRLPADTLDQLVIYFAGHGHFVASGEVWLLSGAPRDSDEAINLVKTIRLAGRSGFGHVVLISDACRSLPGGLDAELTDGGSIFDNPSTAPGRRTLVDVFYASALGNPALELRVEDAVRRYDSVFTQELLRVFREPTPPGLAESVPTTGGTIRVVPNGLLEEHLRRVVPEVVEKRTRNRTQNPVGDIKFSRPPTWIGRANPSEAAVAGPPPVADDGPLGAPARPPRLDVDDLFQAGLDDALSGRPEGTLERAAGEQTALGRTFVDTWTSLGSSQRRRVEQFESGAGFDILGCRVAEAAGLGIDVEVLKIETWRRPKEGELPHGSDRVRIWPREARPGSVLIRFEDGSGCVVAGLPGFVGAITTDAGRVIDVSYLPTRDFERYRQPHSPVFHVDRAKRLHAVAAAAALAGNLYGGRSQARLLGDLVRKGEAVDPTLGIYASYIYGEDGITDEMRDIARIMRDAFSFRLFDIAMLGGELTHKTPATQVAERVVPFCPMLQRGWLHLGVLECQIPEAAKAASRHLEPALWTMFAPAGMDILFAAVRSAKEGRLP